MQKLVGILRVTKAGLGGRFTQWASCVVAAAGCLWAQCAFAGGLTLSNDQITVSWKLESKGLRSPTLQDLATGEQLELRGDFFTLVLTNGDFIRSSSFNLVGNVKATDL